MKRNFSIYKACTKVALSSAAAYRADFLMSLIITLFYNVLFPLVTILIYASGQSFPSWSFHETLLIQSVFTLSVGITNIIMGGVFGATNGYVRSGNFEIILLKPANSLFFIIASTFSINSLGVLIGSIALMSYSILNVAAINALNWLAFLALFIAGVCVMSGLSVLTAAISFKWVGNSRIPEIISSIESFGKYPLTIFPKAIQAVVTFIIPVGIIGFYPASALLGRVDGSIFFAIIPCILFLIICIYIYHKMILMYEGVGG